MAQTARILPFPQRPYYDAELFPLFKVRSFVKEAEQLLKALHKRTGSNAKEDQSIATLRGIIAGLQQRTKNLNLELKRELKKLDEYLAKQ